MGQPAKKLNEVPVQEVKPFNERQVTDLVHAHKTHVITTDRPYDPDELENPELWTLIGARKFNRFDRLQIQPKQGTQLSFGIVLFKEGNKCLIKIYDHCVFEEIAQPEIKYRGYIIRHSGLERSWEIVEEESGALLRDNFVNQTQAVSYIDDHYKALGM